MNSLNNSGSYGIDDIPLSFIKKCVNSYVKPLCRIINDSMKNGCFPESLKQAIVIPVYKKGCANDIKNYRPISLLTSFSKLFEKVIHIRLYGFLKKHNIINKAQHGFLEGRNIETALFAFTNTVLSMLEDRKIPCGILLDLSRAFDGIDHRRLYQKLEYYGVRGNALAWFSSYLSQRKQKVLLRYNSNTVYSKEIIITKGVPQGSILGPLLFVVYFDDIYTAGCSSGLGAENWFRTQNYADDTTLLVEGESLDIVTARATVLLESIENWLLVNDLKINHTKTEVILFSTKTVNYPREIRLNGHDYGVSEAVRLLGVSVDARLKWKQQVEYICKRLSNVCYGIRRLRDLVDAGILRVMYYGCCYPYLKYGIIIWGGCGDLSRVFILQKKILRVMYRLKVKQSCRGLFRTNRILTVNALYIFEVIIFHFKNKHLFAINVSNHEYSTRGRSNYNYPKHRLSLTENNLFYTCMKYYNNLPEYLKLIDVFSSFRRNLFNFLCELEPYNLEDYFVR